MSQASAVVLAYDITNDESFNSLEYWLKIIKEKCRDSPLIGVVVATKVDLNELAVIGYEEGQEFADRH
jgi:transport family protein 27